MSVDAYIAALAPLRQARIAQLRALILEIAPDVAERIEWKMPVFARGEHWVAVASQKSYVSVYLGCSTIAAAVVASDPKLKGGKACVNIPDRAELPLAALGPAIRDALSI